jgi:hypothetical protein
MRALISENDARPYIWRYSIFSEPRLCAAIADRITFAAR